MSWIRESVVAGTFYPQDRSTLEKMLEQFCSPLESPKKVTAIMVPHAGYKYCGKIAGQVYRRIEVPDTAIVLCPNHTGMGKRISVWQEGSWRTPLGELSVNADLARKILGAVGESSGDYQAHAYEHAIEVHLPFLQKRNPSVRIVPIVLGQLTLDRCEHIADALALAMRAGKSECLLVASTDMSHYIGAEEAQQKDALALKEVECLDGRHLYQTVIQYDISMCGFIPTTCALMASKILGASRAEIIAYGNSGDTTGDYRSVVGYASAIIM